MLKEEAMAERKLSVRRKALELLQQAQVFECHEPFVDPLMLSHWSRIVRVGEEL